MATVLARNGFNVVILARREDVSRCLVARRDGAAESADRVHCVLRATC